MMILGEEVKPTKDTFFLPRLFKMIKVCVKVLLLAQIVKILNVKY